MIEEIRKMIRENNWHERLPKNYLVKDEPDITKKMQEILSTGVSDFSLITADEEKILMKLEQLLEDKYWDDYADDWSFGMAAWKSDAIDHSIGI